MGHRYQVPWFIELRLGEPGALVPEAFVQGGFGVWCMVAWSLVAGSLDA